VIGDSEPRPIAERWRRTLRGRVTSRRGRVSTGPGPGLGEKQMTEPERSFEAAAELFGNRFLVREVPSTTLPKTGMMPQEAMRLVAEDLVVEGDPARNLATFVTTWMEPEAQRIINGNLHRNFIDHAEYARTAEIEQRCIRRLADLFRAPSETTGATLEVKGGAHESERSKIVVGPGH
jgi:glutamate/tyrosine decarboxylase-like PLP-dependent enzyme